MFRNIFLGVAFAGVIAFGVGASPASAIEGSDVQAQISALVAKIAELTKQLNQLRGSDQIINSFNPANGSTSSSVEATPPQRRICLVALRDLREGLQGEDVQALQEFLQEQKLLAASPTGFFGPLTREALKQWQAQEGIAANGSAATTGWGTVGPKTSLRIKNFCGHVGGTDARFSANPHTGVSPLTVTFKAFVGGFTPYRYAIDFGDGSVPQEVRCPENTNLPDVCGGPAVVNHIYSSDGAYTSLLLQYASGGSVTDSSRTVLAKEYIKVGASVDICTKEYSPVCGSKQVVCITAPCNPIQQTYGNKCALRADNATFLYEGQCRADSVDPANDPKCKAWHDGCNSCSRSTPGGPAACTLRYCSAESTSKPYCTAYFDSNTNRPPTISGFSGPTTLNVNQSGTWEVKASDPENGPLSYNVNWGDIFTFPEALASSNAHASFAQTSTFTHVYATAGVYTVIVIVKDSAGQSAKSSSTVKVGGETPVACTLQYDPVCGQPPEPACRKVQPYCAIATPGPQTYSNKCFLGAAGATYLYSGQCHEGGNACTADAKLCSDGSYVGRTGPNCEFVCPSTSQRVE